MNINNRPIEIEIEEIGQIPIRADNGIHGPGFYERVTGYKIVRKIIIPDYTKPTYIDSKPRNEGDIIAHDSIMYLSSPPQYKYQPGKIEWRDLPIINK